MSHPRARRLSPHMSLCEGHLLGGRYRIESLDRARPTSLWLAATDLKRGDRVTAQVVVTGAMKELAADESTVVGTDTARSWLLAGARRAKSLEGPHLARVLDAGVTSEGHAWIVREYLASETLASHLLNNGPMTTAEAADVALAICDGLAEAHASGVVHGSLGPHAVHVAWSASGLVDVKVVGTGTAAAEKALSLGTGDAAAILHAPEQLHAAAAVDARVDVWGIGVLLHTMLAGHAPFRTDTPSGASLSVLLDAPPALANVPRGLADLVRRAMARTPDERFRSVLDLAEALTCFASSPDFARDRISARRPRSPRIPAQGLVRTAEPRKKRESFPPSAHDVGRLAPPKRRRDDPTMVIHASTPRRRALQILGGLTAAASLAILVLVGTEGSSIAIYARGAAIPAKLAAAPVAPPSAMPVPAPGASAASVDPRSEPAEALPINAADLPAATATAPRARRPR